MQKTSVKESKCVKNFARAAIITLIFAAVLSVSSCWRQKVIFIPQSELGEVDYYGEIIFGEIPPEVLERIKEKRVEIVSKGFVYRYYEMKKLLKSLDEWKWEE